MNIADYTKKLEEVAGCLSSKRTTSWRRRHVDDEDLLVSGVDPFLIDAELKIAFSKAVRRMLDKTQVMTGSHNLHIRKRITHAGEVTASASFISAILGLNVELTKAIALGHDIGHAPFGHDGEKFLSEVSQRPFRHEVMAVVIAQHIERNGKGLNLTHEVLSGIAQHSRGKGLLNVSDAMTEEAKVMMYADKFAYITADYNDLERIGCPVPEGLASLMSSLGYNQRERMNTLMAALCIESAAMKSVSFGRCKAGNEIAEQFSEIKKLMYDVYPLLNTSNARAVLGRIYEFIQRVVPTADPALVLALMTDQDVLFLAAQPTLDYSHLRQITVAEILPILREKKISWWETDLDW